MQYAADYFADTIFFNKAPAEPWERRKAPRKERNKRGMTLAVGVSLLLHAILFFSYRDSLMEAPTRDLPGIAVHLQPMPVAAKPVATKPIQPQVDTPRPASSKPSAAPVKASTPERRIKAVAPAIAKPVRPTPTKTQPTKTVLQQEDAPPPAQLEMPSTREAVVATPAAQIAGQAAMRTPAPLEDPSRKSQRLEKERYLANLLATMESHKHYPRAARQRRMEGVVSVRFLLLGNGHITALSITGASKLLRIATEKAVRQALPLAPPPAHLSFPFPVEFRMEYRLTGG